MPRRSILGLAIAVALVSCGSDGEGSETTVDVDVEADVDVAQFVAEILPAVDAVDAELGGPQEFFEVTANAAFVNVFVAVDDATAAVAYLYTDGELQAPAPKQEGAAGNTFTSDDIEFDPDTVLDRLTVELPATSVNAFSVYGDGFGATYVVAGQSEAGGLLDIVLTADGQIVSVDPV